MKKIVAMSILLAFAIPCFAQPAGGGQTRDRQNRRGGFNREEMMAKRAERLKKELEMSDEEWTVVKPMLADIMESKMKNMTRGMRGRRGGGRESEDAQEGGRGRGPEGAQEGGRGRGPEGAQQGGRERPEGGPEGKAGAPDMQNAPDGVKALHTVLENKESTPEQIATALANFRAEKATKEAEEKAKQDKLKTVLTARQEAKLVLMGILK